MDYETISMEISSKPEYVSIIRLTTSGIANSIGFSLNEIEDIKVAVSEACTNAIRHSKDNKVTFIFKIIENGLCIEVKDNGIGYDIDNIKKPDLDNPKENGLGIFIIESLMDKVQIQSEIDKGTIIKMTKYLGVDS